MKTRRWSLLVSSVTGLMLAWLLVFLPAVEGEPMATTVLRVDAGSGASSPDGSSWAKAYPRLQDALAAAGTPPPGGEIEIWVAAGLYFPDEGGGQSNNNPTASFELHNNLAIYGGFAGTESKRDERNPAANLTILHGDIDQNDVRDANGVVTTTDGINGTNAEHVVSGVGLDSTVVLDGVVVTAGEAKGPTANPCQRACGGGLFLTGSSPTISGVTFAGNAAVTAGAGLYSRSAGNPVLTDVIFSGNGTDGQGGGAFVESVSNPTWKNLVFRDNGATREGGGMFINFGFPLLAGAEFVQNHADKVGGGLYTFGSAVTLTAGVFVSNTAERGGGIFADASKLKLVDSLVYSNAATIDGGGFFGNFGDSTLDNVLFKGNTSGLSGGAIYFFDSLPSVYNSSFVGNRAQTTGGAIFNDDSDPLLANVLVAGNVAVQAGGGVYNVSNTVFSLVNTTFAANQAGGKGGGLVTDNSTGTVANAIFSANRDASGLDLNAQMTLLNTGTITVSYSLVSGTSPYTGTANITGDPLWARPPDPGDGSWSTPADNDYGDLRLLAGSPAANTGSQALLPVDTGDLDRDGNKSEPLPVDHHGNVRVVGGQVDRGALERQSALSRFYVDRQATAAGSGASWQTAFRDLQDALFYAGSSAEIWVADGVYRPGLHATDTFALRSGLKLYGGFAGGETTLSQRDFAANPAVLSGDLDQDDDAAGGVVPHPAAQFGRNAYHVVTTSGVNQTAVLDGFTITGGAADGPAGVPCQARCGGGLYNNGGSPTLGHLRLIGNRAADDGGAVYNLSATNLVLSATEITANQAGDDGGGLANFATTLQSINLLVNGNVAAGDGGGLLNDGSSVTLTHASLAGNAAGGVGDAVANVQTTTLRVENAVLWGNEAGIIPLVQISSTAAITGSLVQGCGGSGAWVGTCGSNGGGNLDVDPRFVRNPVPGDGSWATMADNDNGDIRLQPGSPAIDTALSGPCPTVDLRGETRPFDGDGNGSALCDMGAYERIAVTAGFSGTPVKGGAPHVATFTNLSSGPFESCVWVFGDGNSSNDCGPVTHTYRIVGAFSVTLTISGGDGSDGLTRVNYIEVTSYLNHLPVIVR